MASTLETVNVLDFTGPEPTDLHTMKSFPNDFKGNQAAEKLFADWAKEASGEEISDEEFSRCLDEGCYQTGNTTILLTHAQR